jgi:hypothetical protein
MHGFGPRNHGIQEMSELGCKKKGKAVPVTGREGI